MSENYFQENRKFLGLKGVIGRRDFIVNYFIIELIEVLLWSIPLGISVFFKPGFLSKLLNSALSIPANQPFVVVLGLAILGLLIVPLYFSSIVRRVRDILGEEDDNRVYLVSSVLSVICYIAYTPVGYLFLGKWLVIFVFLFMMCWEGKITSQKPKSDIIKFNWGAFWGTWIWGIVNKVPITLFAIPLVFTLGILPFMIICGLKGNEWAYNRKKEEDQIPENFYKKQAAEAAIFSIAAPFIIVGCMLFSFVVVTVGIAKYMKASPAFAKKFDTFITSNEEAIVESTFSKIELSKEENKFFVNPSVWDEESFFTRASTFKTAVNYVIIKENKESGENNSAVKESAAKDKFNKDKIRRYIEIANKTRIYSSFNNELLAQYHIERPQYEEILNNLKTSKDLKKLYKILESGYKFNNHPSLP